MYKNTFKGESFLCAVFDLVFVVVVIIILIVVVLVNF